MTTVEADARGFTIVAWDPRHRDAFRDLNLWWLERWFEVEQIDRDVLGDPEGALLARGGEIWFAEQAGRAVGTVALKDHGGGRFELTKLGVDPAAHGAGMGRALCEQVIDRFEARGGTVLYLETNTVLEPARRLYEALAFEACTPPSTSPYARSNLYMEWRGRR